MVALMRYLLTLLTVFMLASCGGGGGGGPVPTITPVGAAGCTPPQVQVGNACTDPATAKILASLDSLGRQVPESFWSGGDSGGGDSGGGSGDGGGADGSAGDGAPIANAPVVLTDKNGRTATTTTDALGYYRIKLTGFTPPFVVKVTRADGTVWYAGSTQTPPNAALSP